ncbi:MAG TPA: HIRAN domain-containing protein [Candidatus Limnocylindrales bacterium]|nr:HIRAN domain-containing protein [Candidatus Limnocylindrales bacterium]
MLGYSRAIYIEFTTSIMILERRKGQKLGYIPRAKNEVLARLMDAGKLVFGKIEGLEKFNKWLKISIRVYMKDM